MADEPNPNELSIIVDLASAPFDFKSLYNHLSSQSPDNADHHYWHFAGLRSYTIAIQTTDDKTLVTRLLDKLRLIQRTPALFPPFWISPKQTSEASIEACPPADEVIKKNMKIDAFHSNQNYRFTYSAGALTQMNKYVYDADTEITDITDLAFYHDRIDLEFGGQEQKLRKTLKADLMDRCAVLMTEATGVTLFINMTGNAIDYVKSKAEPQSVATKQNVSYIRTASQHAQPFYSTVRLVVSVSGEENSLEWKKRLHSCYTKFIEFFHRNHINECFGVIKSVPSTRDLPPDTEEMINNQTLSFIKQYCWQMLKSIGYRFQQRLNKAFIRKMHKIEDGDEFYQTCLHLWRRSSEYYFIDLFAELRRYREKAANLASLDEPRQLCQQGMKRNNPEPQRWSIDRPPEHYAYVPSVTLTPTTICVSPLKLVKTNRVLREAQFGGKLMFALVDVKDENRRLDLFPQDYRSLRWKMETLLESGFDLGRQGRTYRYLHHSQSQLKDKQFWFYHHEANVNFSFEDAFEWMGDFQEEKIVAKHSARIAQCFTSAEETIEIPSTQVKYIDDIHTMDSKYNFTDGVGTMSTATRDSINSRRQFSAVQIRYGGCKGVISVNPDLDNSEHQLRIRKSMRKFKCTHEMLELCRISKPRPLYLNRQIIVLLSHRSIDDRTFLQLQNDHQKLLSESLVYPERAYALLNEKLNRSLFPLRKLIDEGHLNLIQEPFFRQLIITIGKLELAQMRERTRLKLPRNSARNMIGIVDEYGILEYGQVFVQYTELTDDNPVPTESETTYILQQKVVVTKNPCHHPGDLRVFEAVDVPRLRHLKDVIVFPQRGKRPHPNEISGSDLDGDEYAVIWNPVFIPKTENNTPYNYDSQKPLLSVTDRPINRSDIQATVLDISEQCCVGKLCSLHLAYIDLYGVEHPSTLAIAASISEELDAPKTGQHPLTTKQIMAIQAELGNKRPDYFDKQYHELYPSKHILGQLFRSAKRFEPNWLTIQTPPTTVSPYPIDPLLVHDLHDKYMQFAADLSRIYRESIMDIMYVYRFSSDIDLLCRFDSSSPQYKTPLTKQKTESACLIADSAQVEYKQLIQRIRRLFNQDSDQPNVSRTSKSNLETRMAKASALYVFCYTDTSHARRILSLPWLFADALIETRKLNIKNQMKLLSPSLVARALEIQQHRLIGQSLCRAARYLIETKKSFHFHHRYPCEKPGAVEVSTRPNSTAKLLQRNHQIPLIDYFLIEILHHYVQPSLSPSSSPITAAKPLLINPVWQHLLTRFVDGKCSQWGLVPASSKAPSPSPLLENDFQFWSDQHACEALQRLIDISIRCAEHAPDRTDETPGSDRTDAGHEPDRTDYAHANEYLILALQQLATTEYLFPPVLNCEQVTRVSTPGSSNREVRQRQPNNRGVREKKTNHRGPPRKKEEKIH